MDGWGVFRLVVLTFAVGMATLPARAQVRAGSEFRVNSFTPGAQRRPAVSMDGRGNFVVVWRSSLQDGSGYAVVGRRFDPAGSPIGAEFVVNTYTPGSQDSSAVAAARDGSFFAAWASPRDSGGGIFGRRFDADGAPHGPEFAVNSYTTDVQASPAVAMDGSGNAIVVWRSNGQDGSGFGIFGQRFDPSGAPRGPELAINTFTVSNQMAPAVAADVSGAFVVVWDGADATLSTGEVFGQRFGAQGAPAGTEFRVNASTTGNQFNASVAMDPTGAFTVVWSSDQGGQADVLARRFDSAGAPIGVDFVVNAYTTSSQSEAAIATDARGNFVVTWDSSSEDGDGGGVFGQRFDSTGVRRGAEFQVNTSTTGNQTAYWHAVAADPTGNFVVSWSSVGDGSSYGIFAQRFGGLVPATLAVDAVAGPTSDGNGVLEPDETVVVAPGWRNVNDGALTFDGLGSSLFGQPPWVHTLVDSTASYGTVANGSVGVCQGPSGCYRVAVDTGGAPRLSTHLDATFIEDILPMALGQSKEWRLHIGESFQDVSRANPFYRFVETLIHQGFVQGCNPTTYCAPDPTTRAQMAVLVLLGKEGALYPTPPACGTPMFADVPASDPFCPWIEELARRGVVSGCGGGNYCPSASVSREQMAVFVLATKEPGVVPPACTTPVFTDVPTSSPFCRWIEDLARRGVVSGCGGGNYCPAAPVTREQMAVFISVTFGLLLYGP